MGADEHERSWDSAVAGLPLAGWLGPVGRAWWLGDEPERRPLRRPPGAVRPARAVRTVFDDLPRCRPDVVTAS
jgi:hypothetical protein